MSEAPEIPICPQCGEPLKQQYEFRGEVYYVDLLCLFCPFHQQDMEGGV